MPPKQKMSAGDWAQWVLVGFAAAAALINWGETHENLKDLPSMKQDIVAIKVDMAEIKGALHERGLIASHVQTNDVVLGN